MILGNRVVNGQLPSFHLLLLLDKKGDGNAQKPLFFTAFAKSGVSVRTSSRLKEKGQRPSSQTSVPRTLRGKYAKIHHKRYENRTPSDKYNPRVKNRSQRKRDYACMAVTYCACNYTARKPRATSDPHYGCDVLQVIVDLVRILLHHFLRFIAFLWDIKEKNLTRIIYTFS